MQVTQKLFLSQHQIPYYCFLETEKKDKNSDNSWKKKLL